MAFCARVSLWQSARLTCRVSVWFPCVRGRPAGAAKGGAGGRVVRGWSVGGCRRRVADGPDCAPGAQLETSEGAGQAFASATVGEHHGQRDGVQAGPVQRAVAVAGQARVPSASAAHFHQRTDLTTFFAICPEDALGRLLVLWREEKNHEGANCDIPKPWRGRSAERAEDPAGLPERSGRCALQRLPCSRLRMVQ